jgi:hypothetical protein
VVVVPQLLGVLCLALGSKRHEMRTRLLKSIGASVVTVSALLFLKPTEIKAQNQAPAGSLKSPAAASVQTPGGISIFYDVGQGQGWQRDVVMNGSPHLPAKIRQWHGDSRGYWEGATDFVGVEQDPLQ